MTKKKNSNKAKSKKQVASSNTKSLILYLDTSDKEAILAIYEQPSLREGEADVAILLVKEIKWLAHRELSATLSKQYSDILKNVGISQDELTGICVFQGPGSFTGLRIGISFANALAYGLEIPIYATKEKNKLDLLKSVEVVIPEYGAEPTITKPKKK